MRTIKRHKFIYLTIVVLIIAGLLVGCAQKPADAPANTPPADQKPAEQPVTFSFAYFLPANSPFDVIAQNLAKDMEAETKGLVKIDCYPGGQLLAPDKTMEGVIQGAADIGIQVVGYLPGQAPISFIAEQPGIQFASAKAATFTFGEFIETLKPKELEPVEVLWNLSMGYGCIITNKAITKIEDFKGRQFRTNATFKPAVEALKAVPVTMTTAETYEALRQGIVDTYVGAYESISANKFHEVTEIVYHMPLYNACWFCVMNKDAYAKIPASAKAGFDKVMDKYYDEQMSTFFDVYGKKGFESIQKTKPNFIPQEFDAKLFADMEKALAPIAENYAKELDAKGLEGTKALKLFLELRDKYNKMYPDSPLLQK